MKDTQKDYILTLIREYGERISDADMYQHMANYHDGYYLENLEKVGRAQKRSAEILEEISKYLSLFD